MFKKLNKPCARVAAYSMIAAFALLGSACTGSGVKDKGDGTDEAVKEAMKDELVLLLGTKREALDLFEEAEAALSKGVPDLAVAKEKLEKALAISPDFLEAQFNLGFVYESNGQLDKALEAYVKAQQLDRLNTHSVSIMLAVGRTQSLKGDSEAALKNFEEAHRLDPENLAVLNALGTANSKAGKYKEATEYVTKVLRSENENLTALNTLAQIYTAENNRSMAVYVFKKAARVAIGAIKTDEELSAEPAILVLSDKVSNANLDQDLSADIFNNLGMIYLKMDQMALAVYNFTAAAKLSPTHVESRLNVGSIYLRYLNYDGAKAQFSAVLAAAPENCVAKLGLAASNYAKGDRDDSLAGYKDYLAACDVNHASSHLQLQRIFERKEDFVSAVTHCEKFVELAKPKEGDPVTAAYCGALKNMGSLKRDTPVEGGEKGPDGEEIPPEGEEIAPEGGEIAPEGEEIAPEGEEIAPEGEEPPPGGEAPEGGEIAPE